MHEVRRDVRRQPGRRGRLLHRSDQTDGADGVAARKVNVITQDPHRVPHLSMVPHGGPDQQICLELDRLGLLLGCSRQVSGLYIAAEVAIMPHDQALEACKAKEFESRNQTGA